MFLLLNSSLFMSCYQGSNVHLVVKWADTEKERLARRAQKAHSQGANVPNSDSQPPSLFGALPMGYVPSYNGYSYQVNLNDPALYMNASLKFNLFFSIFKFLSIVPFSL